MTTTRSEPRATELVAAADRAGAAIAACAIWHGRRCTWVAPAPVRGGPARVVTALGPDLRRGSAGVGLLLAELAAATGEPTPRRAAAGALRHALGLADGRAGLPATGFHGGATGVAWAAVRAGSALDEPWLVDAGLRLARRAARGAVERTRQFDLTVGAAGTVVGLLRVASTVPGAALVDGAARAGDALLDAAVRRRAALAWRAPGAARTAPLCGVAHGAAGAAAALTELFAATDDGRYGDAARTAFAYGRSVFDADHGGWPDFRAGPRGLRGPPGSPASGYWCNGAPGIAGALLRGHEVLGDPVLETEARAALAMTACRTTAELRRRDADLCLCHGLAGCADVLLAGAARLGTDNAPALAVARSVLGRIGTAPEDPSLLLGAAGPAWLLLRTACPDVPSPLSCAG